MIQVQDYLDSKAAVARIAEGNLSNVKSAGSGLFEYKIDAGP